MLVRLIDLAKADESLEQLLLIVSNYQAAAKGLYRSLGFTTYGTEPNALKVGTEYSTDDYMILRLR